MQKRMTIHMDEHVYQGLVRVVGKRKISHFLEDLARPHVMHNQLEDAYAEMARDQIREDDAMTWSNSLIGDGQDEAR